MILRDLEVVHRFHADAVSDAGKDHGGAVGTAQAVAFDEKVGGCPAAAVDPERVFNGRFDTGLAGGGNGDIPSAASRLGVLGKYG